MIMLELLPGGDQLLLVKQLGRVIDDGLVRAVVLAEQNFARKRLRIEVVQSLEQRPVQSLLGGVGRKDFRTELHVISGQDNSRSA